METFDQWAQLGGLFSFQLIVKARAGKLKLWPRSQTLHVWAAVKRATQKQSITADLKLIKKTNTFFQRCFSWPNENRSLEKMSKRRISSNVWIFTSYGCSKARYVGESGHKSLQKLEKWPLLGTQNSRFFCLQNDSCCKMHREMQDKQKVSKNLLHCFNKVAHSSSSKKYSQECKGVLECLSSKNHLDFLT